MTTTLEGLQQFRQRLYQSFTRRADASLDLIDALAQSSLVESPVAASESPAFRRRFSSIYDALGAGQLAQPALGQLLYESVPEASATLADYEMYALDGTRHERPDAETLPERGLSRPRAQEPAVAGLTFSWLVRLVLPGRSWVAPLDVRRVPVSSTPAQVAAEQVRALDGRSGRLKAIVADSGYLKVPFLLVLLVTQTIVALVRLRRNQVLYGPPSAYSGKGRRPVHGAAFALRDPSRPAERTYRLPQGRDTVCLSAWHNLHLHKLPQLVGLVLRVQILAADGRPRYPRPLWLFWTGPQTVALLDLYRMYQWRFAIEHTFRFLKQHLGLNQTQAVHLGACEQWVRLCALAYWQLLLACNLVTGYIPPWQRRPPSHQPLALTPRQVQRALAGFSSAIGTPAWPPHPAGKGPGRAPGFHPQPRPRYPVVKKDRKTTKMAAAAPT